MIYIRDNEYFQADTVDEILAMVKGLSNVTGDDEWIDWSGGDCPVPGDTMVNYTLRDGFGSTVKAHSLRWCHLDANSDIVAYKVAKP